MQNLLRNRRVGVIAALLTWVVLFAVDTHDRAVLARESAALECVRNRRTFVGAVEMYCLDKNVRFDGSALDAGPEAMHAALSEGRYLEEPMRCGGRLLEFRAGDAFCAGHGQAGSSYPVTQDPSPAREYLFWTARFGTYVVFPFAFWLAIGARSLRWGRRYRAGAARLLPASWVITLNLLCPPAGLIALGRFGGAAVQLALGATALFWYGLPFHLVALPLAAWAAVARFAEER